VMRRMLVGRHCLEEAAKKVCAGCESRSGLVMPVVHLIPAHPAVDDACVSAERSLPALAPCCSLKPSVRKSSPSKSGVVAALPTARMTVGVILDRDHVRQCRQTTCQGRAGVSSDS
jgi:hypothetical protein